MQGCKTYVCRLNYETRVLFKIGEAFMATDYLQAQRIRTRLMTHLRRAFRTCDMLATPTTPVTAPVIRSVWQILQVPPIIAMIVGRLSQFTLKPPQADFAALLACKKLGWALPAPSQTGHA